MNRSGVDQLVDRRTHNPKAAGSTPASALNLDSTALDVTWSMAGLDPSACIHVTGSGAARGVTATIYSQMKGGEM